MSTSRAIAVTAIIGTILALTGCDKKSAASSGGSVMGISVPAQVTVVTTN